MRSKDLVNNMSEFTFHMLGCGAIGSSAAMQLARLGASHFCLYDDDVVEEPNIGVSQYNINDLGLQKVDALKKCEKLPFLIINRDSKETFRKNLRQKR